MEGRQCMARHAQTVTAEDTQEEPPLPGRSREASAAGPVRTLPPESGLCLCLQGR